MASATKRAVLASIELAASAENTSSIIPCFFIKRPSHTSKSQLATKAVRTPMRAANTNLVFFGPDCDESLRLCDSFDGFCGCRVTQGGSPGTRKSPRAEGLRGIDEAKHVGLLVYYAVANCPRPQDDWLKPLMFKRVKKQREPCDQGNYKKSISRERPIGK